MPARRFRPQSRFKSSTHARLLKALAEGCSPAAPPHRIEVYDNSHITGSNPVGVMVVAGPEGLVKNQYRKFNIHSADLRRQATIWP